MPECLKEMRQQAEELDEIYYVYVIDDDERLRGIFPLKKMIYFPFCYSKVKPRDAERSDFGTRRYSH